MSTDDSSMMTVKEVAERLRVSPGLVYKLARGGALGHHRIGAAIRFSKQQVEAYLQRSVTEITRQDRQPRFRHF